MDKKLWLSLTAVLALAGCGGFNGGAVPDTRNRVTETTNTNQTASTKQTASSSAPYRAPESTTPTYGYVVVTPSNLPAAAALNGYAVPQNGAFVTLTRSISVRMPTGNARIVIGSTMWQGTMYQPSVANQAITVGANRTTQVTIPFTALPRVGSLNILAQNLPAGAPLNGTLVSGGWSMNISAGNTPNLNAGPYVMHVLPVTYQGKTYTPTSATQNVTVNAYATTNTTVTYLYIASFFATQTMTSIAQSLAQSGQYVQGNDGTQNTHCNQFLNAFFRQLTGYYVPELADSNNAAFLAKVQYSNMLYSRHWTEIRYTGDWNTTYSNVANAALAGRLVVAATTAANDPHVAIVMPYSLSVNRGFVGYPQINNSQGYRVPIIAEATTRRIAGTSCAPYGLSGVDSAAPLHCGFLHTQQSDIHFFQYTP